LALKAQNSIEKEEVQQKAKNAVLLQYNSKKA